MKLVNILGIREFFLGGNPVLLSIIKRFIPKKASKRIVFTEKIMMSREFPGIPVQIISRNNPIEK